MCYVQLKVYNDMQPRLSQAEAMSAYLIKHSECMEV